MKNSFSHYSRTLLLSLLIFLGGVSSVAPQTRLSEQDLIREIKLRNRAIEIASSDELDSHLRKDLKSLSLERPLLNQAVELQKLDAVIALLDAGADIDQIGTATDGGLTPVMIAAAAGNLELVDLLIARGADLTIVGPEGQTFTALAINSGLLPPNAVLPQSERGGPTEQISQERLDELLRNAFATVDPYEINTLLTLGADLEGQDERGRTPWMYLAAGSKSAGEFPDIVAILNQIESVWGFPNGKDADGNTPLGIAILAGAPQEVLSFLIDRSDMAYANASGSTYHDLAEKTGGIAMLLLPERPWEPEPVLLPVFPEIAVPLKPEMTASDWRVAQEALKRLGLYDGSFDGKLGPATKRGLAAYYRVLLDEYFEASLRTCDEALPHTEKYFSDHPDQHNYGFWTEKGENHYFRNPEINVNHIEVLIKEAGVELRCNHLRPGTKSWSWITLTFTQDRRFLSDVSIDCSTAEFSGRRISTFGGRTLAFDWVCKKEVGGVPSNNGLTIWGSY